MEEIAQQANENSSLWLIINDNFTSNETSFNRSDAGQTMLDDLQSDNGAEEEWKDAR